MTIDRVTQRRVGEKELRGGRNVSYKGSYGIQEAPSLLRLMMILGSYLYCRVDESLSRECFHVRHDEKWRGTGRDGPESPESTGLTD